MIFKNTKPVTSSYRHLKLIKKEKKFSNNLPLKSKTSCKKNFGGRNNQGKLTFRRRGAGIKRLLRQIDFVRIWGGYSSKGIVEKIEYDPNRTSFIGRIFDLRYKFHYYILASANLKRGDCVESGRGSPLKEGNCLPLAAIPVGFSVHNVSIKPNYKGQLIRSAGVAGQLIQKSKDWVRIKLPSGEQRLVLSDNKATLGVLSNSNHRYCVYGKAGRSRWRNIRPNVRGVAKNPVDHPHGGGEGKTSGGRPSVTPWGKPARGRPTSKYKKKRPYILIPYKNKKSVKN